MLDQFQSRLVCQRNIDDYDIGMVLGDSGDCFGRILCFTAHDEVALPVYQVSKTLPNQWMIINYEHTVLARDSYRSGSIHGINMDFVGASKWYHPTCRDRAFPAVSADIESPSAEGSRMTHEMKSESF